MIEEEARQAFDAYAAGFDLYGDEWQDIGSDQYFIAGYCAAIAAQAKRIAELEAVGAGGVGAMMSKPDIATAIHYPAHWDTAAYPTLESALSELSAWFKCSECAQPAPAVVEPGPLQTVSVKHWAQRALEAQPKSDPEYWPLSYKAGHMEDELIELRAALKIAIAASPQLHQIAEPAVVGSVEFKGGMTATDQSRELDAGFAAQNYCRSKWGAARGHAEWRRYHDAFVAGYLAAPQPQQIAEPASKAAKDVLAERERQISVEGWTPKHDDEHDSGQLAGAAACYARHINARSWVVADLDEGLEVYRTEPAQDYWPWDESWWKPTTPRRDAVKACALLLAEIERIDRATTPKEPS